MLSQDSYCAYERLWMLIAKYKAPLAAREHDKPFLIEPKSLRSGGRISVLAVPHFYIRIIRRGDLTGTNTVVNRGPEIKVAQP